MPIHRHAQGKDACTDAGARSTDLLHLSQLVDAVEAGITKINISTHLNGLFTKAVRSALTEAPTLVDPRQFIRPGRDAIAAETARLLTLLAG